MAGAAGQLQATQDQELLRRAALGFMLALLGSEGAWLHLAGPRPFRIIWAWLGLESWVTRGCPTTREMTLSWTEQCWGLSAELLGEFGLEEPSSRWLMDSRLGHVFAKVGPHKTVACLEAAVV